MTKLCRACAAIVGIAFAIGWVLLIGWAGERMKLNDERMWQEGYEAGTSGIPVEACPYPPRDGEREWKRGWISGKSSVK